MTISPLRSCLLVGFSVTEMPGSYGPMVQANAKVHTESGLIIERCGIGGITTEALPYIIDDILDLYDHCQYVVFEIATSYVRDIYGPRLATNPQYMLEIFAHIEHLIIACRRRGKSCAFLNLPRVDVDYRNDRLEQAIAQVASQYGAPVWSVSYELLVGGRVLETLLTDDVHPTWLGAELYASRALDLTRRLVAQPPQLAASLDQRRRYDATRVADQPNAVRRTFRRHGYEADYAMLTEGQTLEVVFDAPRQLMGFAALIGPRSGHLTVIGNIRHDMLFYDQHSYYERMMTTVQDLGRVDRISFTLEDTIPDVLLAKGEPSLEPRQMGLFYIFSE